MSSRDFAIGDRFLSKYDPAIKGEVIGKRLLLDIQHYEFRIESPGAAPRVIIVSRDGVLIKFNPAQPSASTPTHDANDVLP